MLRFPSVQGTNLMRQAFTLPYDLPGEYNLLLIAFYQSQQTTIDSWLPAAIKLEQEYPGFNVYELPVIQQMNVIAHRIIDEGMRAGIPNRRARQRTITLYLDKPAFRRALEIDDERSIYALLVDRSGNLLWRAAGGYTPEKGAKLQAILESLYQGRTLANTLTGQPQLADSPGHGEIHL